MSAIDRQQARAAVGALYAGDEGRAAELLAGIAAGPQIDTQAVVDATMGELKLEPVKDKLRSQYPELFRDQDLASIADRHVNAYIAGGQPRAEAVELAARDVAQKFGFGRSNGTPENADPSATILARRKARGQAV